MALQIVYETHSTTTDSETGLAGGWRPGVLSVAGRRQARELGERRGDDGIDAVFASDLHRAAHTAQIAFARTGMPVHLDPRLRECNYGRLNGHPVTAARRSRHIEQPFPGGQSYREVVEATADFLDDLLAERDGQRVLVIAHSANHWSLECLLNGADLRDLVAAPRQWQPGWEYALPTGWRRPPA